MDLKPPYRLTRARVPASVLPPELAMGPGDDVLVDIEVDGAGRVASVTRNADPLAEGLDLRGRQVWPRMADIHTHLDKSYTWERSPNLDGSFDGAKEAAKRDQLRPWTTEDVRGRMEFALSTALAYGTRSVRTHLDSQPGRTEPTWEVFAELRDAWAGRIALEGVASLGAGKLMGPYGDGLAARAAELGLALGPVVYHGPEAAAHVARAFDLTERYGLKLDFHVDETLDPEADSLSLVAEEALRRGYERPLVCGHCCSLGLKPRDEQLRIAEKLARAGIGVVLLPMTNVYLLGRSRENGPLYRGLPPMKLLREMGVKVAVSSDNCRDPFHPYGDYNLVEVLREGARLAHMDLPWGAWVDAVSTAPEELMEHEAPMKVAPGAPADLVIFEARSFSELYARPAVDRTVLIEGVPLDRAAANPPPFSALDDLARPGA